MKQIFFACALVSVLAGCTDFDAFAIGDAPNGSDGGTPEGGVGLAGDAGDDGSIAGECARDEQCDDMRPCNGVERCAEGTCVAGMPADSGEACTTETSEAGECALGVCVPAGCGDGEQRGSEECDDKGESSTCNIDCTEAECGDGKYNASADEWCDDGDDTSGDGCEASCEYSCLSDPQCADGDNCNGDETCGPDHVCVAGTPRTTGVCAAERCGNGVLDGEELCDRTDLGGVTCEMLDLASGGPFMGGTLACMADCDGFYAGACMSQKDGAPGTPCMGDYNCVWSCVDQTCDGVVDVGAGSDHTCALFSSGRVACWGSLHNGRLGNGYADNDVQALPLYVREEDGGVLETAEQLSVGGAHTCVATTDGRGLCWGVGSFGRLMSGDDSDQASAHPMRDAAGPIGGVGQVVAGAVHSCVRNSQHVRCAGEDNVGQLGDNADTAQSYVPLRAVAPNGTNALANVTAMRSGGNYTCVEDTTLGVTCWGDNQYQQTGAGAAYRDVSVVIASVASGARVQLDSSSGGSICLLFPDATMRCLGQNTAASGGGKLGVNSASSSVATAEVVQSASGTLADVRGAALGPTAHCYLASDNDIYCAGRNTTGQLGPSQVADTRVVVPLLTVADENPFEGFGTIDGITAGSGHMCAWNASRIDCWGLNASGQVGTNPGVDQALPVRVQKPLAPQ
jgi:cysteine-rich repeat protein